MYVYMYMYIYVVYVARRDGTWPCVSRKTDYRGHERLRFLSFSLNLLNPAKNHTLERAQSPPACPFFHIAEYKLCYRPISRSRAVTYLRTLRLQG